MAGPGILYIAEFSGTALKYGMNLGSGRCPPIASQTVVTAVGSSTQSTQFNAATAAIRVSNDTAAPCTLAFGTNPTATATSGIRLSAGQSEYFVVDNAASKLATFGILV